MAMGGFVGAPDWGAISLSVFGKSPALSPMVGMRGPIVPASDGIAWCTIPNSAENRVSSPLHDPPSAREAWTRSMGAFPPMFRSPEGGRLIFSIGGRNGFLKYLGRLVASQVFTAAYGKSYNDIYWEARQKKESPPEDLKEAEQDLEKKACAWIMRKYRNSSEEAA